MHGSTLLAFLPAHHQHNPPLPLSVLCRFWEALQEPSCTRRAILPQIDMHLSSLSVQVN